MILRLTAAFLSAAALAGCSGSSVQNSPDAQDALGAAAGAGQDFGTIQQSELGEYEPDSPEYFAKLIGDTVYFDVDQSIITDQSAAVLRQQARWLSRNPEFAVLLEGHADEQGTREYNLALGARRAAAVKSYLVDLGVEDFRLKTVTYGKERPVAVCSSEMCWSKNRRSVTVVERELGG